MEVNEDMEISFRMGAIAELEKRKEYIKELEKIMLLQQQHKDNENKLELLRYNNELVKVEDYHEKHLKLIFEQNRISTEIKIYTESLYFSMLKDDINSILPKELDPQDPQGI